MRKATGLKLLDAVAQNYIQTPTIIFAINHCVASHFRETGLFDSSKSP